MALAVLILGWALFLHGVEAEAAGSWQKWDGIEASSGWQWKKFGTVNLSSRIDILKIAYREPGVKLDRMLVTTDLDYVPTGKDKIISGEKIYLEAESASSQDRFAPFKVKSSSKASGGKYIEAPKEEESHYNFVPSKAKATYKFDLSGRAAVWMRVSVPAFRSNSLWIKTSQESLPNTPNMVDFNGKKYYLGLKSVSDKKYSSFPKGRMDPKLKKKALKKEKVDLSAQMPPVRDQGKEASSTAWAAAYIYKTYQENLTHNWSINTKKHQFSPTYLYNQVANGYEQGVYLYEILNLIKEQGVCPLSVMPYYEGNFRVKPDKYQRESASSYKIAGWRAIFSGDVKTIKSYLAFKKPVIAEVPVYPDFDVSRSNLVYDDTSGQFQGSQAVTLVGYDDSKQAFKFINSWGQDWGLNGYGWIDYDIIRRQRVKGYIMIDSKISKNSDQNLKSASKLNASIGRDPTSGPAFDPEDLYGPARDPEDLYGPAFDPEDLYGPARDPEDLYGSDVGPEEETDYEIADDSNESDQNDGKESGHAESDAVNDGDNSSSTYSSYFPSNRNVAVNKPIEASNVCKDKVAAKAVDGNIQTYWSSMSSPDLWIRLHLQQPMKITMIKLRWNKRYHPQVYNIKTYNGSQRQVSSTANSDGLDVIPYPNGLYASHIIIDCGAEGYGKYYMLKEIEVYVKQAG